MNVPASSACFSWYWLLPAAVASMLLQLINTPLSVLSLLLSVLSLPLRVLSLLPQLVVAAEQVVETLRVLLRIVGKMWCDAHNMNYTM